MQNTKEIFNGVNKKITSFLVLFAGVFMALIFARFQTFAAGKPYIAIERDSSSGLFTLTVSDPNGIKEFSLLPQDKSPYGGALGNCVTLFKSDNIGYFSPDQFTPKMDATILDCQGNTVSIELPPLKNGATRGTTASAPQTQTTAPAPAGEQNASSEKKPSSNILANIQFPVKELGSCQSEVECTAYCDDAGHAAACLDFAQKHNLLTPDEIKHKEKIASIGTGPGGCTSQASCETYCNDVAHIDECVAFGESHDLLNGKDLADAKKIRSAIGAGKKLPGGCTGKKSCETYCNDADHADECLAFAEDSGLLSQQEIQQYKTFQDFRKKGETPGGCTTKTSCEAYCENPDNMETCLSFGEKTGFVSSEDAAMARKVMPLIKAGKTPGGCKNKDQCEAYCASEDHADECVNFGLQAGMISPQDAEIIKKTGGKGPGGCRGKEQCQTYCEQNQQECADWAKANGLEGQFSGPGGPGGPGSPGFSGPGGCKTKEECMSYCKDHQEECQGFGPRNGGGDAGEQQDGFSKCGIVTGAVAKYVCGINGKGASSGETTYFNRCHAEQQGVQILHEGACGKQDCSDIADPVCGNDGQSWVNDCHAERFGGVKHKGVCTKEDRGGNGGGFPGSPSGGFPGGPGGCKSQEECSAYCKDHQEECKNFSPPGGQGGQGPRGGPSGRPNTGGPGGPGSASGEQCSFMDWTPVCVVYQGDSDHTFNNECFLRTHGGTFKHAGVCAGDTDCGNQGSKPVCAKNGDGFTQNFYNTCVVKLAGAQIIHDGVCTENEISNPGGQNGFRGGQQYHQPQPGQYGAPPGDQQYAPPASGQMMPPSGGNYVPPTGAMPPAGSMTPAAPMMPGGGGSAPMPYQQAPSSPPPAPSSQIDLQNLLGATINSFREFIAAN